MNRQEDGWYGSEVVPSSSDKCGCGHNRDLHLRQRKHTCIAIVPIGGTPGGGAVHCACKEFVG